MLRALRSEKGYIKGFLENQWRSWKHEDVGYQAAYLARLRQKQLNFIELHNKLPNENELDDICDKLYDEVNLLSIEEHWELAKADHLEQVYGVFSKMHKVARNKELVINKRYEELSESTAIIDPDKFPIFNLIDKSSPSDLVGLWQYKKELKDMLQKELGFMLEVKESKIEHHEAGDGVFLKLEDKDDVIIQGSFLGFVPGVIQNAYEQPEHKSPHVEKNFIQRYDGTTINFNKKIPYPFRLSYSIDDHYRIKEEAVKGPNDDGRIITQVPGEFLNPYAYGHLINHPPPEVGPNAILLDVIIPYTFFPQHFMRYLPYIKLSSDKAGRFTQEYYHHDCYHGLGVFALEPLKDGDELYLDYFESSLYSIEYTPDWLIKPPPLNPYLKKYEYETKNTLFSSLLSAFIRTQNESMILNYLERVSHDKPRKIDTEEDKFISKKLNEKKNKDDNS